MSQQQAKRKTPFGTESEATTPALKRSVKDSTGLLQEAKKALKTKTKSDIVRATLRRCGC